MNNINFLFPAIFGGWSIAMIIYIIINHSKKNNTIRYTNLSDKIRKYKRIEEQVKIKTKY